MNPYVILAIVLGTLAAVGGAYWLGDGAGYDRADAAWKTRENKELTGKNAKILELTAAVRAAEVRNAEALNAISTQNQQELRNEREKHARDIAAVRAGILRLRDVAARAGSCGAAPGPAGAGAGGRDATAGAELSGAATEFLLGEAARADEITRQLGRCQDVVRADRN